jgi:S-adenosylmethionine uptake transporter
MSPNLIGALLMVASMACFTFNDTLLKLIAGAVPLFQLIFLRSAITSVLILVTRGRLGPLHFSVTGRDWFYMGLRAGAEVITAYFFLSALIHMPLANVTAILQVVPLSVTLASALILREAVGWRRMVAVAIGFVGVLMIVKPGAEGFNIWSVYALIAVLGVTLRDLATRQLSPIVPSMTVTLVTAVAVTFAAGLASLSEPWAAIDLQTGGMIAASGVFILGGYFFSIQVMRVGDISFTAPFRYTGLVWALILGFVVFGDWPGYWTLAGAAIVVGTGLFTLYRETRLSAH